MDRGRENIDSNDRGSRRDKIIIILLCILLLLFLLVGGWFFIKSIGKGSVVSEYDKSVNMITEIDYSQRQEELDQIVKDGMMNVQYSMKATFDGKVSTSFNVKNIKNNKYPIVFQLYDEYENLIYQSKKIELGYELNSIELDKELSKGTHEGSIKIGYAEEGNVSSVFPITLEVR